jgi:C4-dicarboxylate-specific signal transduction histidine kinase
MEERTAAGETVLFDRHWHRRKDGSRFPVEVHTSLFWRGGRRFLLKVARDISDRVRAEEAERSGEAERRRAEIALQEARAELERVSRVTTMGALTASIAHEVNQPLAGVVTSANAGLNWLAKSPPNLLKTREAIERILRDGNRAGEVLNRIRTLLKKTSPTKTRLSVNQIVRDVMALTGDELRLKNVAFSMELDSSLPAIVGDSIQLQQVLLNLIMNAIEAMASITNRRKTLRIQSEPGDLDGKPAVTVKVSDTGIGLSTADTGRLFEAFHTTKAEGMGMGLWISRSIIEGHGGRLTAQSNDGPGATFQVLLPAETGGSE